MKCSAIAIFSRVLTVSRRNEYWLGESLAPRRASRSENTGRDTRNARRNSSADVLNTSNMYCKYVMPLALPRERNFSAIHCRLRTIACFLISSSTMELRSESRWPMSKIVTMTRSRVVLRRRCCGDRENNVCGQVGEEKFVNMRGNRGREEVQF